MQSPAKRIVSSKAITTKGGIEITGFPPVIRFHLSEDQIVNAKPEKVPVSPPTRVKRRTGLTGRPTSTASLISSTGTGEYAVKSVNPRARSSPIARTDYWDLLVSDPPLAQYLGARGFDLEVEKRARPVWACPFDEGRTVYCETSKLVTIFLPSRSS